MILVHESMPNGTLFESLHIADQGHQSPLSWNQRFEICAGAARSSRYLHPAVAYPIIHGDIKTTNIVLDTNRMAKISGLLPSKLALAMSSHNLISLNMKGSIGYLDPEHYKLQNLTEKLDVFSFGVVLLEVFSGRQSMNPKDERDNEESDAANANHQESLVQWALTCHEKLIDRHIQGKIIPASLAQKCLEDEGVNRPSMIEVLDSLELAQQVQLQSLENSNGSAKDMVLPSSSNLMLGLEFFGVGC